MGLKLLDAEARRSNLLDPPSMSRTYRTTTAYRYALVAASLVLLVSLVGVSHLLRQKERESPRLSGTALEELLAKPAFQKQLQFRDAGFADALQLYTYF